jgi:hypothetical protein
MKMAGPAIHVSTILMHTKFQSEKLNERYSLRWKFNIKMDLKEYNFKCVYLIQLGHDRIQWRTRMKVVMKLLVFLHLSDY